MPVMNTQVVQYDCNVSLTTEQFGPSVTVVVELMDGFEEDPELFQAHLVGAIIKRLKIVAHTSPQNRITGREEYTLDISTDLGYHLGRIKFAMPFATGWNGTQVGMSGAYLRSEAEGHVESALRRHLNVRINQRTPPLPRKPANAKGISEDIIIPIPAWDHPSQAYVQRAIAHRMMAQREQELLQKKRYLENFVFPASAKPHPHDLFGVPAPKPPFPGVTDPAKAPDVATRMSRDVAKRSDDSSRVDTATRGGKEGQDVADMGEELDL